MTEPNKDTIKAIEDFLGSLRGADQADKDAGMRGFGRSVGMFILGVMECGLDVQVAIFEASVLIKSVFETRHPDQPEAK